MVLCWIGASVFIYGAILDIFVFNQLVEKTKPAVYYLGIGLFVAGYFL
jgi:hypothetical protein